MSAKQRPPRPPKARPRAESESESGKDGKVESRALRSKRDDDDVLVEADRDRMSYRGPLDERDEAEVAEDDILEELDAGELRNG